MSSNVKAWCKHCGRGLDPSYIGNCHHCGKTGKRVEAVLSTAIGLKASVLAERTRIYFEWVNRRISAVIVTIAIDIVIAIVATIIGYFVGGPLGALISLGASIVLITVTNFFLRRKAKREIREITKIGEGYEAEVTEPEGLAQDELCNIAVRDARKAHLWIFMRKFSIFMYIMTLSFFLLWCVDGLWLAQRFRLRCYNIYCLGSNCTP